MRRWAIVAALMSGACGTAVFTAVRAVEKSRFGARSSVQPIELLASRPAELLASGAPGPRRPPGAANAALHWGFGLSCGLSRLVLQDQLGWSDPALLIAHFCVVWIPWRLLAAAHGRSDRPNVALDMANHLLLVGVIAAADQLLAAAGPATGERTRSRTWWRSSCRRGCGSSW